MLVVSTFISPRFAHCDSLHFQPYASVFLKSSFAEGSVFSVLLLGGGVLSVCMFVELSGSQWWMCSISQFKKGHMRT